MRCGVVVERRAIGGSRAALFAGDVRLQWFTRQQPAKKLVGDHLRRQGQSPQLREPAALHGYEQSMIAHFDDAGGLSSGRGPAGPLAIAAQQTLASIFAVAEMLGTVGQLAVEYGVGKPLAAYKSLLETYRALLEAEATLSTTASQIVLLAKAAEQRKN
jgi:hypothetical protein